METLATKQTLLNEETLRRVALTRIPGIGPVYTRALIRYFGDAVSVFRAKKQALLQAVPRMKPGMAEAIEGFHPGPALESELRQLEKKGVRPLFFTDKDYPRKLNDLPGTPALLYYRGNIDLNAKKIVAIVGTRIPSDYGRRVTAELIKQMAQPDLLVISGLALGIDAAAHQAALDNRLPTVGVLGHGFGCLYPPENRELAKAMLRNGGLLTSFPYGARPEGHHFPDRNKVVAALCDAVVVVETARKGGSLLTVKQALTYKKKVFAVPGRIMDTRSAGCNWLIRQSMAQMLTFGDQLPAAMGWKWPKGATGIQAPLQLASAADIATSPEDSLLILLKEKDSLTIDELAAGSRLDPSALALALLQLEMQGRINALPGKRYRFNAPIIRA
jgi:DNA processing protein